MPDFSIIEARPYHCGQMVRILRQEQKQAVAKLGFDSHHELRRKFDDSCFRRAWLIDGRLGAIGGVAGTQMASDGDIWLAFSKAATRYPVQIVKEARRQLAEIMTVKRTLHTMIIEDDEASRRFAIFLGFVPTGSGESAATSRFGRRMLTERFVAMAGEAPAIPMVYQQEAA